MEEMRIVSKPKSSNISTLEEGTYILKENLKSFVLFSEMYMPFEKWLAELVDSQKIVSINNTWEIRESIEIPKLIENDCKRYNCMQNRIKFEQLPSNLWKALIGIEDYRFLEHDGVDYVSIIRAFIADVKAMSFVQGGSTLTQQLAKNLFLTNEKKLERKIREMIYAVYIEYKFEKEEILTTYFNEAYWGAVQGVYIKGIYSASIIYFGKPPQDLTDYESSILIGMLKGPNFYHPIRRLERLKNRTSVVYKRLSQLGFVSTDKSIIWDDDKWESWHSKLVNIQGKNDFKIIYQLTKNNSQLWEPFEQYVFLESVNVIKNLYKKQTKDYDVAIKAAIIDKSCTSEECEKSFYYYSKPERNLNKAIRSERHQVGSILKPIIYEQFLKSGKSLDDKVSTKKITLNLKSGDWSPKDGSKVHVPEVSLRVALQKSKNIPLIRLASEYGFDKLEKDLLPYFPNLLLPLAEYPAQLLGAIELSITEIAGAYLKYFNDTCRSIVNNKYKYEQSILYELSKAGETTVARSANKLLKKILIFGKTGTTNNGLDNWYIAFDGRQFFVIWFGVDSERQDKKMRLSGASTSFRIFQRFLDYRGKQLNELYCE